MACTEGTPSPAGVDQPGIHVVLGHPGCEMKSIDPVRSQFADQRRRADGVEISSVDGDHHGELEWDGPPINGSWKQRHGNELNGCISVSIKQTFSWQLIQ